VLSPSQRAYAQKHFNSGSDKPLWHMMQGVFVLAFGLEARRAWPAQKAARNASEWCRC
jgi:hypothetical protein